MKKVGGPARKEMRSPRHQRQRLFGVEAAHQHGAQPGGTRHEDPVQQARNVGHRCWHQHGVGRAQAVHAGHQRRLPAQTALGVQHRLGNPGRSRGEEHQRDVRGSAGEGAGRHRGSAADGIGQRHGVGEGIRLDLQHERGVDLAQGRRHVGGAERVQDRRRHGADAPAGPGQNSGRQAVGHLPGDGLAAPDSPGPQAAGHHRHQCVGLASRQAGGAVDHLAAVRREQGVERGHVPGAAGPPVAPGLLGQPGRSEVGRHGRAPYPGPSNVTPMSGRWRETAWISR